MEAAFGVPVIESYGMTEAAHQMASNPLPPREAVPGLGRHRRRARNRASWTRTATILAGGRTGRGGDPRPRRHRGLREQPDANAKAFTNGWFRTGDQGSLDEAGYLRLTGRLKELINRGGEKISPLEVDAVLMDHPGGGAGA